MNFSHGNTVGIGETCTETVHGAAWRLLATIFMKRLVVLMAWSEQVRVLPFP